MTSIMSPNATIGRPFDVSARRTSLIFVGRSLRHTVRNVDALIMAIALPVILMLLFVFVFGGAIEPERWLRRLRGARHHPALRRLRRGRYRGRGGRGHDQRDHRPVPDHAHRQRGQ